MAVRSVSRAFHTPTSILRYTDGPKPVVMEIFDGYVCLRRYILGFLSATGGKTDGLSAVLLRGDAKEKRGEKRGERQ